jgi:hypothetical protein
VEDTATRAGGTHREKSVLPEIWDCGAGVQPWRW